MEVTERFIDRNYTKGRNGNIITGIVMHTYGGAGTDLYNWFNNPTAQVSAHYAVLKDGTVYQYVRDEDTAWHAGDINDNVQTIGIEHQDDGYWENPNTYTEAQYQASAELVAMISDKYDVPLEHAVAGVRPHNEIVDKACPGTLDWNRIIRMAQTIQDGGRDVELYNKVIQDLPELASSDITPENIYEGWWKLNGWLNIWTKLGIARFSDVRNDILLASTDLEAQMRKTRDWYVGQQENVFGIVVLEDDEAEENGEAIKALEEIESLTKKTLKKIK